MIRLKQFTMPAVVQSPMASCTDLPFRLIARAQGMAFAFLEMISSEALARNVRQTLELMQTIPEDQPVGAQIVGCDPAVMGEAAAKIEDLGFALVDVNLGCPVPKSFRKVGARCCCASPRRQHRFLRASSDP